MSSFFFEARSTPLILLQVCTAVGEGDEGMEKKKGRKEEGRKGR